MVSFTIQDLCWSGAFVKDELSKILPADIERSERESGECYITRSYAICTLPQV
jgi:hypothetical protein